MSDARIALWILAVFRKLTPTIARTIYIFDKSRPVPEIISTTLGRYEEVERIIRETSQPHD